MSVQGIAVWLSTEARDSGRTIALSVGEGRPAYAPDENVFFFF